jgi:hypothetical protein
MTEKDQQRRKQVNEGLKNILNILNDENGKD